MSRYQQGVIEPHQVESSSALNANGDYCIKDDETGLPTLYIYLDGPGMVAVDIEVEDDENAEYTLTQKSGNKSYYTLNMNTAEAGETNNSDADPGRCGSDEEDAEPERDLYL